MATFRCLQSGHTVTFTYQHDIDSMKGHQGYVLVEEEKKQDEPIKQGRRRRREPTELENAA